MNEDEIKRRIHYPECWDKLQHSLEDALWELYLDELTDTLRICGCHRMFPLPERIEWKKYKKANEILLDAGHIIAKGSVEAIEKFLIYTQDAQKIKHPPVQFMGKYYTSAETTLDIPGAGIYRKSYLSQILFDAGYEEERHYVLDICLFRYGGHPNTHLCIKGIDKNDLDEAYLIAPLGEK